MTFNLIPYVAVWSVIALAVVVLFIMRKMVSSKEDDNVHLLHGTVTEQVVVAKKLDVIDKWGKILTVIAVIMGAAIATAYVYSAFGTRGF
ncbi:MAG TPA: hypothetical protein VMJ75_24250 [Candidatus Acidoferrales bacterium]|nr:hypothetical protein [Candidatus Acidoferrales bacterium]